MSGQYSAGRLHRSHLPDDPNVPLDLQDAFSTVYDRARYDLSLNYGAPLEPPLGPNDADWARRLVPVGNMQRS